MSEEAIKQAPAAVEHRTARLILGSFVFTFIAARLLVLLIMLQWVPTLYLHVKGTHVHHLNYGICLLAFIGAYALLKRPEGKDLSACAVVYGIGLALTFDEFGMWVHLGGPYWQRASFDAVTIITAVLGLIAYAPVLARFRPRHWTTGILLTIAVMAFAIVLGGSLRKYATARISPFLQQVEASAPQ